MEKLFLILFLYCIILFIILAGLRTYDLITDKGYHGYPAVTRCRVCDKRVWEWQGYERRSFTVNSEGDPNEGVKVTDKPMVLVGAMSASGLVHKKCEGHPTFDVEVTRN